MKSPSIKIGSDRAKAIKCQPSISARLALLTPEEKHALGFGPLTDAEKRLLGFLSVYAKNVKVIDPSTHGVSEKFSPEVQREFRALQRAVHRERPDFYKG